MSLITRDSKPARAKGPYSRFETHELILRDELALDRTVLANERTLLAWLRLALALTLAGVTFMHFAEAAWFRWVGIASLAQGVLLLPVAVLRYLRMRGILASLRAGLSANASHTDVNPT